MASSSIIVRVILAVVLTIGYYAMALLVAGFLLFMVVGQFLIDEFSFRSPSSDSRAGSGSWLPSSPDVTRRSRPLTPDWSLRTIRGCSKRSATSRRQLASVYPMRSTWLQTSTLTLGSNAGSAIWGSAYRCSNP